MKQKAYTEMKNGRQMKTKMKMEMKGKERPNNQGREGGGTWRFRLVRNDQEKPRKRGKSPSPATAV